MRAKVAVVGNSDLNIGFAVAADLSLAGHEIHLAQWPELAATLDPVRLRGGFAVTGDPTEMVSGRTGTATIKAITTDISDAVRGAEVIFVDAPLAELETRFRLLLPHLEAGQIVHVNTHGGWPALRLAPLLRESGQDAVTITEGAAPTIAAGFEHGVLVPHALRRDLAVAAFPASRTDRALSALHSLYPTVVAARNVLQTGFEAMNMLVHPAIALLNIGSFDRAEQGGERASFYGDCNTVHTGILAEAQDAERAPVCAAFGVRFRTLRDHIVHYYGAKGESVHEAIRNCGFYRRLPPVPAATWRKWLAADVPWAHVPFVALAELAGVDTPLHRAIIAFVSALLEQDFQHSGLTLARLGLSGCDVRDVCRYVDEGMLRA